MGHRLLSAGAAAFALAVVALTAAAPAVAAEPARDRFAVTGIEPAPAGDRFFGVESPELLGTGAFDAQLLIVAALNRFSASRPAPEGGEEVVRIIATQIFFHPGVAITMWDRIKLSVDAPLGSVTVVDDVDHPEDDPDGAAVLGDVRTGLRLRVFGDPGDGLRASISGRLWFPSGDARRFAGEGKPRASPVLVLGGRAGSFTWGLTGGLVFRPVAEAAGVTFGRQLVMDAGLTAPLGDLLQVLLEIHSASVLEGEDAFSGQTTLFDGMIGSRLRTGPIVGGFAVGLGPALGAGSLSVQTLLSLSYAPLERVSGWGSSSPPRHLPYPQDIPDDADGDWIPDGIDACPYASGPSDVRDPAVRGCPDADGDGVPDDDDACPARPGDVARRGCVVQDRDSDGIPDGDDACPTLPGQASRLSRENGCPPDRDSDGVTDGEDACPDKRGRFSLHPDRNGCPREGAGRPR